MGRMPDGWMGCPEIAKGLIEGIFLVFKTPVENNQSSNFTINNVFDWTKNQQWHLGLWIDLTNTKRYFSDISVTKKGVQYIKIQCVGQQSPSSSETNKFIEHCKKFLDQNPGKVIGVHCTHGFNRTGFLICAYLSRVKGYKAHDALQKFAAVRPPGIYRQNLVDDFVTRYGLPGEPGPPNVSLLAVPWKMKNGAASIPGVNNNCTDTPPEKMKKPRMTAAEKQRRREAKCPFDCRENYSISFQSYLANRPEVQILDSASQQKILHEIRNLAGLTDLQSSFLGHPPTLQLTNTLKLTEENFAFLKTCSQVYRVTWCPQEYFPYLIYMDAAGQTYMVNSENLVLAVPTLLFPDSAAPTKNLYSTILEGFVVTRKKTPDAIVGTFCFEIVDIIAIRGMILSATDFRQREYCIAEEIIRARAAFGRRDDYLKEPFLLQKKILWPINNFEKMQIYPWSSHYTSSPNGLMFYPIINIFMGQSIPILNWQCPKTNSSFFRLSLDGNVGAPPGTSNDINPSPILRVDDNDLSIGEFASISESRLSGLNGRIIECAIQFENNRKYWKFKREAKQRTYSDSYRTAKCIWDESIAENVTMKQVFVDFLSLSKESAMQSTYRYNHSTKPVYNNYFHNQDRS